MRASPPECSNDKFWEGRSPPENLLSTGGNLVWEPEPGDIYEEAGAGTSSLLTQVHICILSNMALWTYAAQSMHKLDVASLRIICANFQCLVCVSLPADMARCQTSALLYPTNKICMLHAAYCQVLDWLSALHLAAHIL